MGCTFRTSQERYLPKFLATSDVLYCVLKQNSSPQCWCGLATDILTKCRLNWKLKISNAADNADVTESQARDTRHRRMQEVNSLCTDSWPLRANTVLCHSIQYSFLVNNHSDSMISVLRINIVSSNNYIIWLCCCLLAYIFIIDLLVKNPQFSYSMYLVPFLRMTSSENH